MPSICAFEYFPEPGLPVSALQRREKDGLITSDWAPPTTTGARSYRITASGRQALGDELESWRRFAAGLEAVLRAS